METTTTRQAQERGPIAMQLCPRCGFHPGSPRIVGYCSWDCYEADDEEDADDDADQGVGGRAA